MRGRQPRISSRDGHYNDTKHNMMYNIIQSRRRISAGNDFYNDMIYNVDDIVYNAAI